MSAFSKLGHRAATLHLPKIPLWCGAVVLLLWICAYYAYGYLENRLLIAPREAAIERRLESQTRVYQSLVNRELQQVVDSVTRLARGKNTLDALLVPNGDASRWQESARTLRGLDPRAEWMYSAKTRLPAAEQILLLPAEASLAPLSGNFVAELLVEEARKGDTPPPRAARLDEWRIFIARPITTDGRVAGVLLVGYPPAIFARALEGAEETPGRISVIQAVERFRDVVVYFEGNGWKEEYSATLDTQVENWTVKFTGSKAFVEGVDSDPLWFILSIASLIAAVALLSLILVGKTVVFPERKPRTRSGPSYLDNLFTQKHHRSDSSAPQPAPAPVAKEPKESKEPKAPATPPAPKAPMAEESVLPAHVFRDYDIRGKAHSEISLEFAELLGKTLGTLMLQHGDHSLMVCADGRISSPRLKKAFSSGVLTTGCDLVDIGQAPTPVMNYALAALDECTSGVMITASHNPSDDNGFKIVVDNRPMPAQEIRNLRAEMAEGRFIVAEGDRHSLDVIGHYIQRLVEDVTVPANLRVAIDCGNGIASVVAPDLFRALGCQVKELCTEVDGNFPVHDPDPTVSENLRLLISTVVNEEMDLGLAFDGDGDRVVAVTGSGRIVWPDELLMIFARDVITRNPGADVVFDVKSTRRLEELIASYGGQPVMWKTGHAPMRNKVRESGAPLGGEYSGHIFFNDRWYGFDDGLYTGARLLEIIGIREQSLDEIFDSFPAVFATEEIKLPIDEERKQACVQAFIDKSDFGDARLVTIDGLRVEYDRGWGLLRASNTSAALTLRFEADTEEALADIIADFDGKLTIVDKKLGKAFANAAPAARS